VTETATLIRDAFTEVYDKAPRFGVTLGELDEALRAGGHLVPPADIVEALGGAGGLRVRSLRTRDDEQVRRSGMLVWVPIEDES